MASIVSSVADFLYAHIQRPWVLALILPAALIIWWLMGRHWVQLKEDENTKRQRLLIQRFMKVTRVIMATLLLIAIASPYVIREQRIDGEPFVRILVDNSTSMRVFDADLGATLHEALSKKVTTELKSIGGGESSPIGDGILEHLKNDESILLISDGRNTRGSDLGDVALFATKLNVTVNAIDLKAEKQDHAVTITGPTKTVEDVENTFTVRISSSQAGVPVHVKVTLDGAIVYDEITPKRDIPITKTLRQGTHLLEAEILETDFFPENNKWHKSVKVVPKPKVFFFGEGNSPAMPLINELYSTTTGTSLPGDLSPYYAIVLNNQEASKITRQTVERLTDYLVDGNGLVAIGGKSSFEKGGYQRAPIETILPVFVSTPGKKEGDVNIVLVMDISGSTASALVGGAVVLDVNKALALGIVSDLAFDNRLGVIAFNTQSYTVHPLKYLFESPDVVDKLKSIQYTGGTLVESGIIGAVDMLRGAQGSKNIILISDGLTQVPATAENAAKIAANEGIRIYSVGVGPQTNAVLMKNIADLTNGIYFAADDTNRIRILFGKAEDTKRYEFPVAVIDSNHFVTQDLKPQATIFGFNEVVPKTTAKMLVATGGGEPVITIWRVGLGRVAAWTTDDGNLWAGQLIARQNAQLLTRTLNWAVGDPDRKALGSVTVKDGRINEPVEITVKSDSPPVAEGTVFARVEDDLYSAVLTPTTVGFQRVLGATYGVNYAREYDATGVDPELEKIVRSTGGKMFAAGDVDAIAEAIKSHATRTTMGREDIRWPFVIGSILVFLVEVFVRRILRRD